MENQAVREPRPLSCDPLGTGLLCSLVRPLSVPVSSSFQFDPFLVFVPGPLLSACREVVVCLLRSHDCVCSRTCFYHGQLAEHLVNLATVPVCPSSSHEWVLISFSLVFACIVINLVVHLHIVIVYSLEFLIYNDRHNFN